MQNIGKDNAGDDHYRYKMPKLVAKVEGRGNGIKTNIVNNVDIAKALKRPPTYTLKHFGCELGAQTNFNKSTGISIVNGAHDAHKLSDVLEIFIKKFVQCYKCGNPETVIEIKKERIFLRCNACGRTSDVDMREKLTTHILKNPPESMLSKQEAKVKKEERERMRAAEKEARRALKAEKEKEREKRARKKERKDSMGKRSAKSENGEDGEDDDDDDDDDEEEEEATQWKTDLSADAVARRQREQLTGAAAMLVQGAGAHAGDDENGAAQPADEAENQDHANDAAPDKQDQAAADAPAAADAAAGDEEGGDDDEDAAPVERTRKLLATKSPLAFADVMVALEPRIVPRMKLFYEAMLEGAAGRLAAALCAKDKHILAMAQEPAMQASQLIALEYYVTQVEPQRMAEMPFVLKMLYEEDLIDDSIIVAWGGEPKVARKHGVDKESALKVRELSQAVLEWLEEASEDESGEEGDDGEN